MGEIRSAYLFVIGIGRRWWGWAPTLIVSLPEINRAILHPLLPPAWQFDITWLPSGVVVAGYGLLFWAAIMTFHEQRMAAAGSVRPNMPLERVLRRITGSREIMPTNETTRALVNIRQSARLGHIQVWGKRLDAVEDISSRPLVPINKDWWEQFQIDLVELMRDSLGKTEPVVGAPGVSMFCDLHFDKSQIRREFPTWQHWIASVRGRAPQFLRLTKHD